MTNIGDQIHLGAMVFMKREFRTLGILGAIVLVLLFLFLGFKTSLAFVVGALASGLAGYFGMFPATHANVRTTTAANREGAASARSIAFFGGSVMGLLVASMGLLGLGILYLLFGGDPDTAHVIHGFGMGASLVALFSRVGGGIFTKSADVGADLVGKVEAGIPEDDPRNPGVIADNVGDVAGMGYDIFESYCGAMIATNAIASTITLAAVENLGGNREMLMGLPLPLASVGLLCSIAGIMLVRQSSDKSPEKALRTGTLGASVLFIGVAHVLIAALGGSAAIWGAVVAGVAGGVVIGFGISPEALGGMLGGALVACVLLALTMANAGGAWDNAKKWVEKGKLGGKGSDVHKAAVVGDTVGDPFKDTSGPSMNILINVMAIVSLVIAPIL